MEGTREIVLLIIMDRTTKVLNPVVGASNGTIKGRPKGPMFGLVEGFTKKRRDARRSLSLGQHRGAREYNGRCLQGQTVPPRPT